MSYDTGNRLLAEKHPVSLAHLAGIGPKSLVHQRTTLTAALRYEAIILAKYQFFTISFSDTHNCIPKIVKYELDRHSSSYYI